jgi:2-iminobutanoate/2-iminopropanoate deaminase
MRNLVATPEAPAPVGHYSQAIRVGSAVYCAGQIPVDPKTNQIVSGDIAGETRQALSNLRAVLKAAHSGMDKVVRTTVFLTNLADYEVVNKVYAEFFPENAPSRTTVQVAVLPRNALIEIDAIAID